MISKTEMSSRYMMFTRQLRFSHSPQMTKKLTARKKKIPIQKDRNIVSLMTLESKWLVNTKLLLSFLIWKRTN